MELVINIAAVTGVACCFLLVWKVLKAVLLEPWRIKRAFEKQGVKCLPYTPPLGNLPEISRMADTARASPLPLLPHNITLRISPHYELWKKTYGDIFVFWLGYKAVLTVNNPEHIKEILSNKFGHFKKLTFRPDAKDLVGDAVGALEGERWAQHRRIVSPAFFVEKLKVMAPTMIACIHATLDKWEKQIEGHTMKEIDVHEEFKVLTADIIAHTAFGSSYEEGMRVFMLQHKQQVIIAKRLRSIYIPGFRETVKQTTLGSLSVPANTLLMMSIISSHCNPAFWGKDALDFNPQRFEDGVGSACETPFAFFPFSMGPRNCLGQNFAMVEARAILAMMLQRFRFSLSPGYSHCPTTVLTLQPQYGMPIIFEKL